MPDTAHLVELEVTHLQLVCLRAAAEAVEVGALAPVVDQLTDVLGDVEQARPRLPGMREGGR